jgi:formylmethanofuran dehydrogenase subunit E
MYIITDDPLRDFDRYDALMADKEAKLPHCEKCGDPINDDIYFEIDGEILCENCMCDIYARSTEDYISDHY